MKKIKQLIIILLCLFINITSISASTKTLERTDENNYGVNKHWNINNGNIKNVKKTPYVNANEKIYDYADILSEEEEKDIYEKIDKFIKDTHIDMVFVSIDMPYTYDAQNEDYAADFYDYNDFGIDFENYSGILLLRNKYSKDPYFDMYTFGNAQLYFNETRYDDILDTIYNYFYQDSNYPKGLEIFVNKCKTYYDRGYATMYKHSYVDKDGYIHKTYHIPFIPCTIGAGIITLITMIILVKKNKMVKKSVTANEYLDKGSINYSQSIDQFVRSHTTHYTVSSSSGGGGSHGGSSGGGHSSGGGRHG